MNELGRHGISWRLGCGVLAGAEVTHPFVCSMLLIFFTGFSGLHASLIWDSRIAKCMLDPESYSKNLGRAIRFRLP